MPDWCFPLGAGRTFHDLPGLRPGNTTKHPYPLKLLPGGDLKKVSYILGYPPRGSKNVSYPPQAPSKLVKQGGGAKKCNLGPGTCLLTFFHPPWGGRQIGGGGGVWKM